MLIAAEIGGNEREDDVMSNIMCSQGFNVCAMPPPNSARNASVDE